MARAMGSVRHLEWVQRLERYAQSQLTVNEFCEWEGVSPATFYNWRKKLATGNEAERVIHRRPSGSSKCDQPGATIDWSAFLPVQLRSNASPRSTSSPIRIRLPNGVCIFLPEADAATIETVISAVGRLASGTAAASQRLHAREEELTC